MSHSSRSPKHVAVSLDQVDLSTIASNSAPPAYSENISNKEPRSTPLTSCCGCVSIRAGVFVILILQLVFTVIGLASGMSQKGSSETTYVTLYGLSCVSVLVYLVLLFSAAKYKVQAYGIAAKANVGLFALSTVVSIVSLV